MAAGRKAISLFEGRLSQSELKPAAAAERPEGSRAGGAPIGMAFQLFADADGSRRFIYVSPTCEALNGVSPEAVLADAARIYELILPDHRERMAQAEAAALAGHTAFDVEVPFRRPDGAVRWHRITSAPREAAGGGVMWDGMQIDITEQKAVEAELAESRRRLNFAVEATGLGFWEFQPDAGTLRWSDRTKELFGLAADAQVRVEAFWEAVHPEDRGGIERAFAGALDQPGGGGVSFEHRVRAPDGGVRWLLSHGRVIFGPTGEKLVVGTCVDVTERRLAEERRKLVTRELAHRVKNGLSVMLAILKQTAQNAISIEDYVATVTARLQAMAASQDLVTGAAGPRVGLARLLDTVLEPFGRTRFEIDADLEEIGLTGDLALGLALLTHELATNALKYGALSNADGRVVIRRLEARDGHASVAWSEVGGPPVTGAHPAGFGTRLLQAALRGEGGKVEGRFEPDGFKARLEFPTSAP